MIFVFLFDGRKFYKLTAMFRMIGALTARVVESSVATIDRVLVAVLIAVPDVLNFTDLSAA